MLTVAKSSLAIFYEILQEKHSLLEVDMLNTILPTTLLDIKAIVKSILGPDGTV